MEKPTVVMTFDNSSTFGGSINSLYYMAKSVDRSSLDLIIVSGQAPEYLHDRFKNLTCYHFKSKMPWIDNKMYSKFKKKKYFDYMKILMKCILILRSVYWFVLFQLPESVMYVRLIRKHNVQVLHFNSGVTIPLIIASKLLKIPCINHLRGFVAQDDSIVRFFFQCADHHVAISTSIRDNLLKLGVPPSRISLVNDAVDLEEFNQDINVDDLKKKFGVSSQNLTYGIFGRVIPWKGIREFIFAAKEVNKRIPGAIGFIVGDHSDGDSSFFVEMQTLSTELGLEGKLIFAGFRPNVIEMMALMDIVVHASIEPEPFGMVIIEGMAMGKPVIATRGGGPLDIIEDGQSGILVQLGNPVALADAIISLLINSNLRNLMGQKGRCRVEEFFSSTLYAKKMGEIFQRFISY